MLGKLIFVSFWPIRTKFCRIAANCSSLVQHQVAWAQQLGSNSHKTLACFNLKFASWMIPLPKKIFLHILGAQQCQLIVQFTIAFKFWQLFESNCEIPWQIVHRSTFSTLSYDQITLGSRRDTRYVYSQLRFGFFSFLDQ